MATKKENNEEVIEKKVYGPEDPEYWEEKIPYVHPKDYRIKGDDSVSVSVNGEEIRIKRGVPVNIKRKFVEVLQQSLAADAEADEYSRSIEGMRG